MKKCLKIIRDIILWTFAVLILALVTFPLWGGFVTRMVANIAVPKVTGTDFSLDRLVLNPYTGRIQVEGVLLANPFGYKEANAVTVGKFTFQADSATLLSDVVRIKDITLDGASVSYLDGGEDNVNNFKQIQYNAAGGKEAYETAEAEKKAEEKTAEPKAEAESSEGKRFVIDHLKVTGVRLRIGMLTISLPTIELSDIGKKSGGATLLEVGQSVWNAAVASSTDLAKGIGSLVTSFGDGAIELGADAVKLGEDAGKVLKGIGVDGGKAVDAVGDGAKKATESLKNLIKF